MKLVECRYVARDVTKNGTESGRFSENIDTESTAFVGDVGKIKVIALIQYVFLLGCQDFLDLGIEFVVRQLAELDRHQVTVHPQHRWYTDRQVDVGTSLGKSEFQKGVNSCHCVP